MDPSASFEPMECRLYTVHRIATLRDESMAPGFPICVKRVVVRTEM